MRRAAATTKSTVRSPRAPPDLPGRCRRSRSARPVISWARSLRCLASSIAGSMALTAFNARSSRLRASSEDLVDVVGVGVGRAARRRAATRASRSTSARSMTPATISGSSRMRRITAASVTKRPGLICTPTRVAHDVLEAVGLVEHHDVVVGQDRPAAGDVQAVEVRVDDDDVGHRRPAPCQLGEARVAHRAAVGAGALVAADGDRRAARRRTATKSSSATSPVGVRGHPLGDAADVVHRLRAPARRARDVPGRRRRPALSARGAAAGRRSCCDL